MPTESHVAETVDWSSMSDHDLLASHFNIAEQLARYKAWLNRAEYELAKRVEARGGTGLPDKEFLCDIKEQPPSPPYAYELLKPLLEIFNGPDLGDVYIAASSEWVKVDQPELWNIIRLKKMAKRYGDDALGILNRARLEGRQVIKVSRREEPADD